MKNEERFVNFIEKSRKLLRFIEKLRFSRPRAPPAPTVPSKNMTPGSSSTRCPLEKHQTCWKTKIFDTPASSLSASKSFEKPNKNQYFRDPGLLPASLPQFPSKNNENHWKIYIFENSPLKNNENQSKTNIFETSASSQLLPAPPPWKPWETNEKLTFSRPRPPPSHFQYPLRKTVEKPTKN